MLYRAFVCTQRPISYINRVHTFVGFVYNTMLMTHDSMVVRFVRLSLCYLYVCVYLGRVAQLV